jgi:hypothetical protein
MNNPTLDLTLIIYLWPKMKIDITFITGNADIMTITTTSN